MPPPNSFCRKLPPSGCGAACWPGARAPRGRRGSWPPRDRAGRRWRGRPAAAAAPGNWPSPAPDRRDEGRAAAFRPPRSPHPRRLPRFRRRRPVAAGWRPEPCGRRTGRAGRRSGRRRLASRRPCSRDRRDGRSAAASRRATSWRGRCAAARCGRRPDGRRRRRRGRPGRRPSARRRGRSGRTGRGRRRSWRICGNDGAPGGCNAPAAHRGRLWSAACTTLSNADPGAATDGRARTACATAPPLLKANCSIFGLNRG